jgi:hypothetical protein
MTEVVEAYVRQSSLCQQILYESIMPRSEMSAKGCAKHVIMILPGCSRFQPSFQFGIFVLFAADSERPPSSLEKIDHLKEKDSDFFCFLQYVVPSSHVGIEQEAIQKQLDTLKFSSEQQEIIWRWIKEEIHFIK